MPIDPITGQYVSPFAGGALATNALTQGRRYENAPGTMAGRAFGRGIDAVQLSVGSAVQGLGRVQGIAALDEFGQDVVDRNRAEIAQSAAMENDDLLSQFVGILGENAPQLLVSAGAPIAGGLAGFALGGPGGAAVGLRAGTAVSGAFNYAQLAGENREAQRAENERQGLGEEIDEARAFGAAVPQAALETLAGVFQARLAARAASPGGRLFSRQGGAAVRDAAVRGVGFEGATEVGQQAITRAQAGQSLTDQEALSELAVAGLAGAVLGGTLGGAGTAAGLALSGPERVKEVKNEDMQSAVDSALALPAPAPGLPSGQMPMPAAAPEAAQPEAFQLMGEEQASAPRPFEGLQDAEIFTGLQALERKIVAGQASTAEAAMLPQLRREAEARNLEIAPDAAETGAVFSGQSMQDLRKGLRALDRKAKKEGLTPEDIQVYRIATAEIERRRAGSQPEPTQQAMLFDEMDPIENAKVADVRVVARELGLSPNSKLYRQNRPKNVEELYDQVLDGLATEDGRIPDPSVDDISGPLAPVAERIGIGRDFDAELAQLEQARDQIEFPSRAEIETDEGRAAFEQAQSQRAEIEGSISQLRAERGMLTEALARREQRVAARQLEAEKKAAAEAIAGDAKDAAPLTQEVGDVADLDAIRVAPGSNGAVARAFNSAQRDRLARQAELQRQEQQFREAEAAAEFEQPPVVTALQAQQRREMAREEAIRNSPREQELRPTEVVSRRQSGRNVEIGFSRGENLQLERRDGGWYAGDTFVARDLNSAIRAAKERRDVDAGFLLSMRGPMTRPAGSKPLPAAGTPQRAKAVRGAVAKAMSGWEAPYKVYVLNNVADLPAGLDQRFRAVDGMDQAAGAMMPNGTVILFADNVSSPEDAVATMFHEVLGHVGLRRAFGEERRKALLDIYDNSPAMRDMMAAWRYAVGSEAMETFYSRQPLHVQIEEAIATFAEDGPVRATFLQKTAKVVADFARRLGLKIKIGNAELRAIIADAHERAMRGDEANLGPRRAPRELRDGQAFAPDEVLEAAQTYPAATAAEPMLRLATQAARGTPDTPQGADTALGRIMDVSRKGVEQARGLFNADVSETIRSGAIYFQSLGHIRQKYGRLFPMELLDGTKTNALALFEKARQMRASVQQIYARAGAERLTDFQSLPEKDKQDVMTLMGATFYQLDPNKALDQHTHLTLQERNERRKVYNDTINARRRLSRNGNISVYQDMVAMNEASYFQQHALDLYDVIRATPGLNARIAAARTNPVLRFAEAHHDQSDPARIRRFWQKEIDTLLAQAKEAVETQRRQGAASQQEAQRVETLVSAIQDQADKTEGQLRQMKDYPYFHLARFGKYSASFRLKTILGPDGKVKADPRAVEAVAEALHKLEYNNVEVNESAAGASVFIRTEYKVGAEKLVAMAQELQKQGFVDQGYDPRFNDIDPVQQLPESARRTLDGLINELQQRHAVTSGDDDAMAKAKQDYVERVSADLRSAFLARLPDRSVAKVMARRGFKAGYDKNMVRAFAQRMEIAANASASRLAGDMAGEALQGMQATIRDTTGLNQDKWAMISITREMFRREETRPDTMVSSFIGNARAFNHNYFLAMNPGYWLTQVTQLQTNLWPELVKNGASYREALGLMSGSLPTALKVVRAALSVAKEQGFKENGADATVTSEVLQTVVLSDDPKQDAELKDFVLRLFTRGVIDIGSAARALGRASEGRDESAFDFTMRWAGSGSYYLEVTGRLVAALSARELAIRQGKDADAQVETAVDVVNEAMLNYTEGNRGRAFGRQGLIGEATPLATAFMTFQFLMVEKYSRELFTAFGADRNTPEGKAARRWLGSHFAAMGMLAGSLGLPFVTVVARVIDMFGDALGDDEEPFDIKTGYRNFLADIFGEDVAEVISRGLPRAVGFDISGRIGAADILPFSQLIADRREFDEAFGDMTTRSYGSSLSMATDMLTGAKQVAEGNIFEGMRTALPVSLKNPLTAIKLADQGFTDTRGNLLPLDPTVADIVYQAVGLSPAKRAEYSEANFAQAIRRGVVSREATKIRRRIATAVQTGDLDAVREGLERAREFDRNVDPSFAILPNIMRSIGQAGSRLALARALDAPLGVRTNDLGGQALTRFANN